VVFGGLGVALGAVLGRLLIEPKRGAAEDEGGTGERMPLGRFLAMVRQNPTALLLMGAFVCANFVAVVLLSWMPKFLYDRFHLGLAAAGLTATLYVQLASLAGSALGGWLADALRQRTAGGRIVVQAIGVFGGAPFVVLCGMTASPAWLVVALTAWGLFKGLYDANIFASLFDSIDPEARGTAAGFMNMVGWLGGGGVAPVAIGFVAERSSLGFAIAAAALVYVIAGGLLLAAQAQGRRGAIREFRPGTPR
jgi:sugar phosphate permease